MAYNRTTVLTKGRILKLALLEAGLFQNTAAKQLGIPYSTFNMKLLGERSFTKEEEGRLAEMLGKPRETLFPISQDTESVSDTQVQIAAGD